MRILDILGLALSALWQQKTRTLLTTLGVIFGSFVLAASLSIGQSQKLTSSVASCGVRQTQVFSQISTQRQAGARPTDTAVTVAPIRVSSSYAGLVILL